MANHKDETNLILAHDLRNHVSNAISHTLLFTMFCPDVADDENITAIMENLKEAIDLSEKISLNCVDAKKRYSTSGTRY